MAVQQCVTLRGADMYLKFIGTDGSMGLKHGDIYDVYIETVCRFSGQILWTRIYTNGSFYIGCPYSSPQSFSANWESP